MNFGIVRIISNGLSIFSLRSRPVQIQEELRICQDHASLRRSWIKCQSTLCSAPANVAVLACGSREPAMSLSHSDVSRHKFRIGIDGLLKVFCGSSFLFIPRAGPLLVQVIIPLEVCVQNAWVYRLGLRRSGQVGSQPHANLTRYFLGNVAFQRENVAYLALIAISPNVLVCGTLDELRRDSHTITGSLHR